MWCFCGSSPPDIGFYDLHLRNSGKASRDAPCSLEKFFVNVTSQKKGIKKPRTGQGSGDFLELSLAA